MKRHFSTLLSVLLVAVMILAMVPAAVSADTTKVATFEFGADGATGHADGSDVGTSKSYTEGGYTLALTSASKVFAGAKDETGKSCLKLGTSNTVGTFSFTVASDVTQVIIYVAKYKAKDTTIDINGTQTVISTSSNDGNYTPVTVDTTTNKTVTFATVSGKCRCMINTIEFYTGAAAGGGNQGGNQGGSTTTPTPVELPDNFILEINGKYVTDEVYTYTGGSTPKDELVLSDDKADAATFTLVENADDTISLKVGDKFLFCDATDVNFADTASENTKFVVETTNDGFYIKCATAQFGGNAQYLEIYSGYVTVYKMTNNTAIYTFSYEEVTLPGGGTQGGGTQGGNQGGTQGGGSASTGDATAIALIVAAVATVTLAGVYFTKKRTLAD